MSNIGFGHLEENVLICPIALKMYVINCIFFPLKCSYVLKKKMQIIHTFSPQMVTLFQISGLLIEEQKEHYRVKGSFA